MSKITITAKTRVMLERLTQMCDERDAEWKAALPLMEEEGHRSKPAINSKAIADGIICLCHRIVDDSPKGLYQDQWACCSPHVREMKYLAESKRK